LWVSTLDNVHMQVGLQYYQECGAYNTPDMLTVGQGAQTFYEYRAQVSIWSVLGAPLIIGADIRNMTVKMMSLLVNEEVIAVDQDPECVQGSLARQREGTETWIKPLSDGSFAVVLLNTMLDGQDIELLLTYSDWDTNYSEFYPAAFKQARIRDLWKEKILEYSTTESN
jgi:alpha-galactosidase